MGLLSEVFHFARTARVRDTMTILEPLDDAVLRELRDDFGVEQVQNFGFHQLVKTSSSTTEHKNDSNKHDQAIIAQLIRKVKELEQRLSAHALSSKSLETRFAFLERAMRAKPKESFGEYPFETQNEEEEGCKFDRSTHERFG